MRNMYEGLPTKQQINRGEFMAKILIADDEELIRRLLVDCLTKEGYEVFDCENGDEAFATFKNNRDIELCLLDIMMPGIDGWELTKKIREISGVPIMLISARSQDFDKILGFESGADEYITKPFSLTDFCNKVSNLLKRGAVKAPTGLKDNGELYFKGLRLDTHSRIAYLDNKEIVLRPKEFGILKAFLVAF